MLDADAAEADVNGHRVAELDDLHLGSRECLLHLVKDLLGALNGIDMVKYRMMAPAWLIRSGSFSSDRSGRMDKDGKNSDRR